VRQKTKTVLQTRIFQRVSCRKKLWKANGKLKKYEGRGQRIRKVGETAEEKEERG